MRKLAPLFFAVIFSLFLMPFVHAGSSVCDGNYCLTYNTKYTLENFNAGCEEFFLDTNDTSNYIPEHFYLFCEKPGIFDKLYITNSSFYAHIEVDPVTDFAKGLDNGITYNNVSDVIISLNPSGSDLIFETFQANDTFTHISQTTKSGHTSNAGLDYFNGNYWVNDDHNHQLEKWDTSFNRIGACSLKDKSLTGVHHLNLDSIIIVPDWDIVGASSGYYVVFYDESCNIQSEIWIEDFTEIGIGDVGYEYAGITGNFNDSKLWITNPSTFEVFEFDMNLNATPSTLTPVSPLEGSEFVDNNIVMQLNLNAGVNGTLNCYVNDVLKHTESYENGTHSIDFSSGELPDGDNTWVCNFTDYVSYSWDFDEITFSVSTGIMNTAGSAFADLFGFKTDDYSTATEKGRAFLALIITFAVALGIGGHFKSPEIAGMAVVGFLMIFTFTGDLPAWLGILLIIISGFIMVEWVKRLHGSKR